MAEGDGAYSFVVRTRIGTCALSRERASTESCKDKETEILALFIDIKVHALQQMLSTILKEVSGVSVQEDSRVVGYALLKAYRERVASERHSYIDHIDLLLDFIESAYSSTTRRLRSLLKRNEITHDLLWVLFRPNAEIFTTCPGIEQPMCVRYNHGEERKRQTALIVSRSKFGTTTSTEKSSEKPQGPSKLLNFEGQEDSTRPEPTRSSITNTRKQ
ncbi:hypothetical protein LTR87_013486 [Friedmanniomyces endolithicus]|nr:hypothetical protein LTR87_013486 [Friedmanniomyces endolithicus]